MHAQSAPALPVTETASSGSDGGNDGAWKRVTSSLRAELGEDVYTSWFSRLALDGVDPDGTARLSVPTRFLKSWIESHYADRIVRFFTAEIPDVRRLSIGVRSACAKVAVRPAATIVSAPIADVLPTRLSVAHDGTHETGTANLVGSPLDRRLTFANFHVGRSNTLAYAAAQQVAKAKPHEPVRFNPLYVHASVGLGKTHLLQAVGTEAESGGRRVLYLTAERFMFGFVSALRAQTALAFKETLRGIDVLIIDDVQFLQGKSVQQEFGHTLNALIDANKQVVIAADRPPAELESLDERLRSRLAGGLSVEMGGLDEELRLAILKARVAAEEARNPGFSVPSEVLDYVAQVVTANGRDLDGAINRLVAHNTLTNAPVTLEMAEQTLRDLVRTHEPKRVKIEDIQRIVARHYNVSRADVLSSRRTQTVVRPRQVAMYLSKILTLRSLPEIGRRFGGRDHTTVLHAVRKIEALVAKDAQLAEEIDLIKRMLQE
ncbi:chromosomal replication initiator protein DnaA [Agaricicola taiwanensis]|uniref:Chromosomal replication initiator protein DnaA n=1 Tax=Agaricicola taiwanensis TaxID=591372 RepID=A0A8J2VGJ0_9RHOB|nr:chromosomal replication initiator protein DnaA [Agaricicola taiwanensis]GGE29521.1 chromosomal replication initiator protein DnaA [Agaricicola taiwanensis]